MYIYIYKIVYELDIEGGVLKGFRLVGDDDTAVNLEIPIEISMINFNSFGYNKKITEIDFTEAINLKVIGQHAFVGNPIAALVIPSNITLIDQHAFGNCWQLKEITFAETAAGAPVAAVSVGIGAFAGCSSLEKIIINSHLRITHLSFEDRKNLAAFPYTISTERDNTNPINVNITQDFEDLETAQDYVRNCALFYEFKKCEVTFKVNSAEKLMTKNRKYQNFSNPREIGSPLPTRGGGRIHRNIKSNSIKSKISKKKKYKAKTTQKK